VPSLFRRYRISGAWHELRFRRSRTRPSGAPHLAADACPVVSVVCVTNRPERAEHVAATFTDQDWVAKELIVVANCHDYPREPFASVDPTIVDIAPSESLGRCLNDGFALASGDVIVRIDDDDWYAPGYLTSVVAAFSQVEADALGKLDYFAYVESLDAVIRLYEGRSEQYVGRVAGGSLAVLRERVAAIRFPEISLGEDVAYVQRCERAGLRVWATAPQGFLQFRGVGANHTWSIDDEQFSRHARVVGTGRSPDLWA
jgi:glycosyltransferase involved in cell wall biosynthesis